MEFLKRNYLLLLTLLACLIVATSLVIERYFLKNNGLQTQPGITITPSPSPNPPIPGNGSLYRQGAIIVQETEAPILNQGNKVAALIKILPFTSKNFKLEFNKNNFSFTATIDKNNLQQGSQDLDQFLRSQGIEDRSWLINLNVVYQ